MISLLVCPAHPDKHLYRTHTAANLAAKSLRRKARVFFRAYECPHCGWFHLTTQGKRP